MEGMDLHSRNSYIKVLSENYWRAGGKKEKSRILNEYCQNTGQTRKYAIRKIKSITDTRVWVRKKRKEVYEGEVKAALVKIWEIFDYPCGQRLKPLLVKEVDRLIKFGELNILEEIATKLKKMSSATIDRKLKHQREVLRLLRTKGGNKTNHLLKQRIPIRLTQWDTAIVGYTEIDLVMHCGSSLMGEHLNTLSTTEISSGWWEGEIIRGKAQSRCFTALKDIRGRTPFIWKGFDSDNGTEFINDILFRYSCEEHLEFTRSRPYKKNDNAYIEEKNWTHVRKLLGYLRYDTIGEMKIINDLYRNEFRLYKNFFQPVMKLISKERIGGKIRRKYDIPRTPYERLLRSDQTPDYIKKDLITLYNTLNPAVLKKVIDNKIGTLLKQYEHKANAQQCNPDKKQTPRLVTSYVI